MDRDIFGGARFFAKGDADVAAIILGRKNAAILAHERQARENGHAVIALLAVHRDMGVAELFKITTWKLIIGTFGFLQTQHVRSGLFQEALHKARTKADGVDVPCGDGQAQSGSPFCSNQGYCFTLRLASAETLSPPETPYFLRVELGLSGMTNCIASGSCRVSILARTTLTS